MSTTNSAFLKLTAAQLVGSTVQAAGAVIATDPTTADRVQAAGNGTRLDKVSYNAATAGLAKNGCATVALTGTTPVTLSLLDLTLATAGFAGDTTFATINNLVFTNSGAGSLTLAPGGSNPFDLGLGGTTPTLTLPAGATHTLNFPAGKTVDATHKNILITPAADTSLSITIGGA